MKKLLLFLSQFIIACAVLSWEHIFSLPILFFALTILFFAWQPPIYRQMLLVLLSVAFASLYQLPFTVSIWLFLLVIGGYVVVGRMVHTTGLKVVAVSVVASLAVALITHFHFSGGALVIGLTSAVIMIVLTRLVQFEARSEFDSSNSVWNTDRD